MKLLHHLLSSAVCVAVLAATTVANVEGKVYDSDYATPAKGEGHFGPFRGPEVEHNFDRSELYPGPEESEDDTQLVPAAGGEYEDDLLPQRLSDAGIDNAGQATEFDQEAFEDRVLAPDVFLEEFPAEYLVAVDAEDGGAAQPDPFGQELLEYTRHLRSLVDPPRPQEPLAFPALALDDPEPPAIEPKLPGDSDSKANLRGPEQDQL
ncbi:hypothetical protein PHYSODRAFT_356045 [Phytophthora sojae]|uniref:RxLR effector protein n=2 Tax=Phytophthora sojae TaxID=67593 RepID=G5AAN2_PHYSP|nr:hypothetical protein PHYSODRAFT_356045 [Phytophthora sojae]AAO24656.1 unknown protein [Phytophthora sojae]EGZ07661.1 hypothetical protein PHYSODRAFT_356045 [Phytophthora sojae]|eukprot:XP_009537227.1 hypothetical protein PHYSODRAFT_356045 [Phytophthora sojae]